MIGRGSMTSPVNILVDKISKSPRIDQFCFHRSQAPLSEALEKTRTKDVSTDEIIDVVYSYSGYGLYKSITPQQHPEEFSSLLNRVKKHEPETIVEIGSAEGGTLFAWSRAIDSAQEIVSIDMSYPGHRKEFFQSFANNVDANLYFLERDSTSPQTANKVTEYIGEGEIDLLFIDGDHSYEGAKADLNLYFPLVNEGGLVAFHDIVPRDGFGVPKLWSEVSNKYPSEEYIDSTPFNAQHIPSGKESRIQQYAGVGVIEKK